MTLNGYEKKVIRIDFRKNPIAIHYEIIITTAPVSGAIHGSIVLGHKYVRYQIHDKSVQDARKFVDLAIKYIKDENARLEIRECHFNDDERLPKFIACILATRDSNDELIILEKEAMTLKDEDKK